MLDPSAALPEFIDLAIIGAGSQLDARNHPLLHDVLTAHPLEIVNGLPVVDEHLRWQGCEFELT